MPTGVLPHVRREAALKGVGTCRILKREDTETTSAKLSRNATQADSSELLGDALAMSSRSATQEEPAELPDEALAKYLE
eukprot:7402777-Pyramimonas_sp.AAC.1